MELCFQVSTKVALCLGSYGLISCHKSLIFVLGDSVAKELHCWIVLSNLWNYTVCAYVKQFNKDDRQILMDQDFLQFVDQIGCSNS